MFSVTYGGSVSLSGLKKKTCWLQKKKTVETLSLIPLNRTFCRNYHSVCQDTPPTHQCVAKGMPCSQRARDFHCQVYQSLYWINLETQEPRSYHKCYLNSSLIQLPSYLPLYFLFIPVMIPKAILYVTLNSPYVPSILKRSICSSKIFDNA